MRNMGGLRSHLPITYWTYVIATLAIAGVPFTAGFFSKDLILWQAFSSPYGSVTLWMVAWITAGMTAFYMFRQLFLVFHGACRADEHVKAHIHESPAVMTLPLIVLAIGAIFSGWLGAPEYLWGSRWDHWLVPIFGAGHEAEHGSLNTEITLMLLTLAVVSVGILLAYLCYSRGINLPERLSALAGGGFYRLLLNKYYIDELYDFLIVRPFTGISQMLAQVFDPKVIDGAVNGIAAVARGLSAIWRGMQTGNVQHYLVGFVAGAVALLAYYLGQP
jgi:NADH-quinone oxidoreductase subunit L